MNYTFDNIGQWVEELAKKPKATQFHTYARVMRDKDRQEAEKVILDRFDKYNMHRGAKDVTIINDNMAIVKYASVATDETYYIPVVKDKQTHWWFKTFESALLGAISLLNTDDVEAAKYAGKILEVKI